MNRTRNQLAASCPAVRSAGRALILTLALALLLPATGCATNPATGQRQFNLLSTEREVELGEEAQPDFIKQYGGKLPDDNINRYVRNMGNELAAQSERPDLPWEFHVVDSATVNAFALPGGKIFITRGLLSRMENEAQLAGVLGHEVAHVTAEHIDQQLGRQVMVSLGLAALGAAAQQSDEAWLDALGVGAQVGGGLYLLSFGRSQENQADELGLRYMTAVGYNPEGQVQVMRILKQHAEQRGGQPVEFLSTHPLPQTRIDNLQKLIDRRYPDHNDPNAYRLGEAEFENTVINALQNLPPAKHNAQSQQSPS